MMEDLDQDLMQGLLRQDGDDARGGIGAPHGSEEDVIRKGLMNHFKKAARDAREEKRELLLSWCRAIDDATREVNSKKPSKTLATADASASPNALAAVSSFSSSTVAEASPVESLSLDGAKEFIGHFLRTSSDTCNGGTLESLSVPYLRALLKMAGMGAPKGSKTILYSQLATFYYTECEKMKKREHRQATDQYTNSALQALSAGKAPAASTATAASSRRAQTAAEERRQSKAHDKLSKQDTHAPKKTDTTAAAAASAAPAPRPKPPALPTPAPATAASSPLPLFAPPVTVSSAASRRARAMVGGAPASSSSAAPIPVAHSAEDDQLHIAHTEPQLKRVRTEGPSRTSAAAPSPSSPSGGGGGGAEWSDRRFTTAVIVATRNDCSTPQDIAKAVRQLGYPGTDTLARVEREIAALTAKGTLYMMGGVVGLGEELASQLCF